MQLSGERVCVDAGGDLPGPLLGHRDAPRQQAEQGDGQVGYNRIYQRVDIKIYGYGHCVVQAGDCRHLGGGHPPGAAPGSRTHLPTGGATLYTRQTA